MPCYAMFSNTPNVRCRGRTKKSVPTVVYVYPGLTKKSVPTVVYVYPRVPMVIHVFPLVPERTKCFEAYLKLQYVVTSIFLQVVPASDMLWL